MEEITDREKAQAYDDLMAANHIVVKDNISRTKLYQLNRSLYSENQGLKYDRIDLLLKLREK